MANGIEVVAKLDTPLEDIAAQYGFTEKQTKLIGVVAINRSLGTIQSRVVKRLAAIVNLKQSVIRDQTKVNKANFNKMQGSVVAERKPIPLIDFPSLKKSPTGMSVIVRKGGSREVLTSTFVARMKNGHMGVFERARVIYLSSLSQEDRVIYKAGLLHFKRSRLVRPDGSKARVARLPIIERFGLTPVGAMVHTPGFIEEETKAAGDVFQKNLMSQINRRLERKKPTD